MLLTEEAKVCLLHVHFALHLSFWHMGSRRSLLLIEWDNFTYGLITVNYQQREEFAEGQLNPTHGFSERLPRISVICHASQWHFAPPQRTTAPRTSISGASFCWEPSSKQQTESCTAPLSVVWSPCSGRGMERKLTTAPIFPTSGFTFFWLQTLEADVLPSCSLLCL